VGINKANFDGKEFAKKCTAIAEAIEAGGNYKEIAELQLQMNYMMVGYIAAIQMQLNLLTRGTE
jgi:hypothetical protein